MFILQVMNDGGRADTGVLIAENTEHSVNLKDFQILDTSKGVISRDRRSVTTDINAGEIITLHVMAKVVDVYKDSLNAFTVTSKANPQPGTFHDNDTLKGDDDQADVVTLPALDTPTPLTPGEPQVAPPVALPRTGTGIGAALAGLTLLIAGAVTLIVTRRKRV